MFKKNNSRSSRDSGSTRTRVDGRSGSSKFGSERKSFKRDDSSHSSSYSPKKFTRDFSKKSFDSSSGTRSSFKKDADYKNKENFGRKSFKSETRSDSHFKSDFKKEKNSFDTSKEKSRSSFRGNRSSGGFSSSLRSSSRGVGRGFGRGGRGRSGGRKNSVFNDITKFINHSNIKKDRKVEDVYIPVNTFESFNIDERLKKNILESGYVSPTMIQDKSIPSILDGRDIVGIANTGTGKTASFLIPLIDKVLKNKKKMVIILAPTRELAVQIDNEFKKFAKGLKIWSILAVGGMPIYNQIKDFKYDHNFVIGTPGRIKDLIDRGVMNIKEFDTIVLDESDRMLDMGFVDDMKFLMSEMGEPRHTIFFSATVSPSVDGIIKQFLSDPVSVVVKTRDTAESVDQDVVHVVGKQKINILHDLLLDKDFEKVIIFVKTKAGVDRLQKSLKDLNHKVIAIHGDKRPRERNFAIKSFKDNHSTVLIATDVAARGLDIPNVTHVINYDLPSTYEDYIHRIGRTGRAGKIGKALTFVD